MTTNSNHQHAGIDAVAAYLPSRTVSLEQLRDDGLLRGSADTLRSFGFDRVHVAGEESNVDMAVSAAQKLLSESDIDRNEIGLILYATALSSSSTMWNGGDAKPSRSSVLQLDDVSDLFNYPASCLQSELDLPNASVIGVNQLGCASIFAALRMARAMIISESDLDAVLCVSADKFPAGQPRDLVYNVVSDGASAALVRRASERNRIIECTQVTKGALWDSGSLENEIVAAYFPTAKNLIESTLEKAGLTIDDIALVIPHNVSARSWEILGRLIGCPPDRIYTDNIRCVGHTIASDNLLNLRCATEQQLIAKGDYLLLFTFGYGLNWACMILEH
ncbi:MAG TPA: 3-oxoacyl-[acyl-carrier-protein] synthase III C-terminal domain-containing protein [Gemmatimonadaceae bacterium]|nr:3-oxoacyl-[acyl-carrier-protein] synthase III C-terminal domain-containing protein [Gemmatimonadaceae bacterium]